MNSLDQQFTDKLYANYEANMKYAAIKKLLVDAGCLQRSIHFDTK